MVEVEFVHAHVAIVGALSRKMAAIYQCM